MISFKESLLTENMKNISKTLTMLAKKPEYKKVSNNLLSLAARAAENDKGAPNQLWGQLGKLSKKVGKKEADILMRLGKLAGTYK
jgi:hypothetical protein